GLARPRGSLLPAPARGAPHARPGDAHLRLPPRARRAGLPRAHARAPHRRDPRAPARGRRTEGEPMTAIASSSIPVRAPLDIEALRAQFPALHQSVHGKPLVYLDSAATALKPNVVIEAVSSVYAQDCANIHRAVHTLSQRATARYEATRETVR